MSVELSSADDTDVSLDVLVELGLLKARLDEVEKDDDDGVATVGMAAAGIVVGVIGVVVGGVAVALILSSRNQV